MSAAQAADDEEQELDRDEAAIRASKALAAGEGFNGSSGAGKRAVKEGSTSLAKDSRSTPKEAQGQISVTHSEAKEADVQPGVPRNGGGPARGSLTVGCIVGKRGSVGEKAAGVRHAGTGGSLENDAVAREQIERVLFMSCLTCSWRPSVTGARPV